MNKYRFFGLIAALGIFFTAVGAWMKILHKPNANIFLTVGIWGEGIGVASLVWFIFIRIGRKNK